MTEDPIVWEASRERWQWFATLTFKDLPGGRFPGEVARESALLAYLRILARTYARGETKRQQWNNFYWLSRSERGELYDRPHYHVLISNLPNGFINPTSQHKIAWIWRCQLNQGFADVRAYADAHDGVGYVLKKLQDEGWTQQGANAYEIRKFRENAGSSVRIAQALVGKWRGEVEPR